jgi:hypothetical protein
MSYPEETKRRQKEGVMFDGMKGMKLTEQVTLGDTKFVGRF